jgi:hypothetical protein
MEVVARVAAWRGPRRANLLLKEAYASLKRDNVTLEKGMTSYFCLIRV